MARSNQGEIESGGISGASYHFVKPHPPKQLDVSPAAIWVQSFNYDDDERQYRWWHRVLAPQARYVPPDDSIRRSRRDTKPSSLQAFVEVSPSHSADGRWP